ncbi:unnamed protein product [Hymenolepis diminuta]|uniref:Uncharacterized protein n=1 Tax=Hymenolepis diminuta TaxID=6216 RepID=A0A564Z5Q8_HYMDI|nr:unnamed protein product [Hymenolepis diminuta]
MPTPAQVVSKRMGNFHYQRYDISGSSPPRRTNSQKPAPEADRKNPTGSQSRRRPQGGQGSDTDSGSKCNFMPNLGLLKHTPDFGLI